MNSSLNINSVGEKSPQQVVHVKSRINTKTSNYLQNAFGVRHIRDNEHELDSALYLQVSIISQALIFVTRSRSWSYVERPGILLMVAFIAAQLVCTLF